MKEFVQEITTWPTAIAAALSLLMGVLIDNLFLNQKAKRLINKSEKIFDAWEELKAERDEMKALADAERERANAEKRYSTELKRKLTLVLKSNEQLKAEKKLADSTARKFKDTTDLLLEENEKIMDKYLDVKRDMDDIKAELRQIRK